jgi:peptidoglycan/LPS O-acetylase OafA/YrhL
MKETPIDLNKYSKAIDGLRAIAVFAVIANHFDESILPSGYLGVDIFFVISGFVITSSLLKRKETNSRVFFKSFYKRRIKRLVPALLFCFSVTAVLISFFSSNPRSYIITGLSSIPGFSNVVLYFNAIDYWGESAHYNPFMHTWSLGVEEQFYLIFPLALWLLTYGKWNQFNLRRIKYFLIVTCLFSFIGYVYFQVDKPMMSYFLMPFRLWEIGLGCLLYFHLKDSNGSLWNKIINKTPLFAFIFIIGVILMIPKEYGVFNTILVVLLTLMLIIKIKQKELYASEGVMKILTSNPIVYVGRISYSLYLWHWVIIVVSRWTIGINYNTILIQLLLIFIFSTFSYHLIEKPLRHISWRSSLKTRYTLLPMFGITLFFVFSLNISSKNYLYLGNKEEIEAEVNTELPPTIFRTKCSKIRTIGNSHSIHILPMLNVIAENLKIELISEKHPDYIVIPNGDRKYMDKLEEIIQPLSQGDLLVLSSRNRLLYQIPYLDVSGEKWIDHSLIKKRNGFGLKIWLEELDEVLEKTQKSGINVVLILPNVEFDTKVVKLDFCSTEWFRAPSESCDQIVSRKFLESRFSQEFYSEIQKRIKNKRNFFAFDPLPIYCPDSTLCSNSINGITPFKDTNHLSPKGALLMLKPFYEFLVENHLL